MHCYFNLVNGNDVIPDDTGVEVSSLEMAQSLAHRAIQEIRAEADLVNGDWRGWRLNVVCPEGSVLASICLSAPVQ
ncbi:hypothetical protein DC522_14470 [Microvirga sp. KLBC 81]|uniref:DUF6894 family protein n=1 Tax=Microvirga sp. KLBC 81 TaxID=1862707 RepID=UPI000D51D382|nr:hypothetical protein [Microvirga sp. KLBC 81]PVE23652.1 hypothetical protein DC522_14470 [Microvirga sp. KLBC 81]